LSHFFAEHFFSHSVKTGGWRNCRRCPIFGVNARRPVGVLISRIPNRCRGFPTVFFCTFRPVPPPGFSSCFGFSPPVQGPAPNAWGGLKMDPPGPIFGVSPRLQVQTVSPPPSGADTFTKKAVFFFWAPAKGNWRSAARHGVGMAAAEEVFFFFPARIRPGK